MRTMSPINERRTITIIENKMTTDLKPDFVTKVKKGNTTLTVNAFFKQDGSETLEKILARVILAETAEMKKAA